MLFQKRWITTTYGPEFNDVLAEIETITNPRHLKRIARQAARYEFRMAAMEKLDDQQLLINAARHDGSIDVRIAALKRIEDAGRRLPIALAVIQDKTQTDYYRIAAIETVINEYESSQADLLEIISRSSPSCVLRAAKLLRDKAAAREAFLRVAKDPNAYTSDRIEAIEEIRDGEELLSLVMTIDDGEAALKAARKIPDAEKQQLAFTEIATAKRFPLNEQLDAASELTDREARDAALRQIMSYASMQSKQQSGTYTWQDKTMLKIVSRCKMILEQDGA